MRGYRVLGEPGACLVHRSAGEGPIWRGGGADGGQCRRVKSRDSEWEAVSADVRVLALTAGDGDFEPWRAFFESAEGSRPVA